MTLTRVKPAAASAMSASQTTRACWRLTKKSCLAASESKINTSKGWYGCERWCWWRLGWSCSALRRCSRVGGRPGGVARELDRRPEDRLGRRSGEGDAAVLDHRRGDDLGSPAGARRVVIGLGDLGRRGRLGDDRRVDGPAAEQQRENGQGECPGRRAARGAPQTAGTRDDSHGI